MKAIPVSGDRYFRSSDTASRPPADAPMATTGKAWWDTFYAGVLFFSMAGFDFMFAAELFQSPDSK